MKGDFTRGHNPDLQRGKRYRRVLLQQGRVLLDSDHAAAIGAIDRSLRELSEDLGCSAGSPDHGFLITPGKLYAVFDQIDHVSADSNAIARRDYEQRYLDRYPSLYIEGTGVAGAVEIELLTPHAGGQLRIWCRSVVSTTFTIQDVPQTVSLPLVAAPGNHAPLTVSIPATNKLRIVVDPGERVWIGLIESYEDVADPSFWIAPGHFHLAGLVLDNPAPLAWPDPSLPGLFNIALSDHTSEGGYLLAYLEGWERLHTHRHDRGIREEALGGELDTTVRTEAIGQVKLMWLLDVPELDELLPAFAAPQQGDGTLDVTIAAASSDPDPCALPIEGGYTGLDNRRYHFEVHQGGALGTATIKWSRDNGSELFSVEARDGSEVTLAASCGLQDGDLVELLSEIVELGDMGEASYTAGQFTPPQRRVGQLALLVQQDSDSLGRDVFELREVADASTSITINVSLYATDQPMLLRRWHGLIETVAGPTQSVELEHGITLELAGTQFDVGTWWEWEARVLRENDNGSFKTAPHGPERRFAPLALFQNDTSPLQLLGWAEHRFTPACELDADHVAFDGAALCSDADTVQEALTELYQRTGCCEVKFSPCHPSALPDQQLIAELILSKLPNGGVLCLQQGVYTFTGTLDLGNLGGGTPIGGNLKIKACGDVVIVQTTNASLFQVPANIELELEGLTLLSNVGVSNTLASPATQIRLNGDRSALVAERCMFVMLASSNTAVIFDGASRVTPVVGQVVAALAEPPTLPAFPTPSSDVILRGCVLLASEGIRANNLRRLELDDTRIRSSAYAISARYVRQLELHDSTLTDSLIAADFIGVNANNVLANRYLLRDRAGDFNGALGSGYGFASVLVFGGSIDACRVAARVGLFTDTLWATQISDCLIRSSLRGAWFNRAIVSNLVDLNVDALSGDGVALDFRVRATAIERCTVNAVSGSAILVGATFPSGGNAVIIEACRVVANIAGARDGGIGFGTGSASTGYIDGATISSNTVRQLSSNGGAAIVINRGWGSPADREGVLVQSNTTRWAGEGISASGPGLALLANQVSVDNFGTGIYASGADQIVVRGNVVRCLSPDSGVTGLLIDGCNRAQIHANHVLVEPDFSGEIQPFKVVSFGDALAVTENVLAPGICTIGDGRNLTLRGNLFRTGIEIVQVIDGEVTSNRAEGTFSYGGDTQVESILVYEAEGRWRVADNDAQGCIRLMPRPEVDFQEAKITAIVTDNRAMRVQVGWVPDGFNDGGVPWPKPVDPFELEYRSQASETVVIVTENLCDEAFIINDYQRIIFSHNAAPEWVINLPIPPGGSIESPNLQI